MSAEEHEDLRQEQGGCSGMFNYVESGMCFPKLLGTPERAYFIGNNWSDQDRHYITIRTIGWYCKGDTRKPRNMLANWKYSTEGDLAIVCPWVIVETP